MLFEKDENGLEYRIVDGQSNHFLAKGTRVEAEVAKVLER